MKHKGFTFIELLVVVSIIVLVFGLAIASFNAFNRRERVKQAALNLKSVLRFAQTRAISVEKPSSDCTTFEGISVSFTLNTYTVSHLCSEGLAGTAESVTLPSGVSFASIPSSFVFQALTKNTDLTANQTIQVTNATDSYSIQITTNGEVNDIGFQ